MRCSCDTPLRKAFAEEFVKLVESITAKHNLEVHVMAHDPFVIAARGCLKGGELTEQLELSIAISGDLRTAENTAILGLNVHTELPPQDQIHRSFDISQSVARPAVADAMPETPGFSRRKSDVECTQKVR